MKSMRPLLWLAMLLSLGGAPAFAEDFEIHASLHGYNLLWPSQRCCSFDFDVSADGSGTVVTKINSGKSPETQTQQIRLSQEQIKRLRKVIDEVRFFSIPAELCCGPVDSDVRQILIRIGKKTHRVEFHESAYRKQKELDRAFKLWTEIRSTFKIPGENVD